MLTQVNEKYLRKIDKMYDDGLLTRTECVKAKKKYLEVNRLQHVKKHLLKKLTIKYFHLEGTAFFIA